ncbi:glycosyltransferase [Emticicia agri]|uniref:Glycosyltransferase n=1 Tax=Emticicia agri TaxID=2492393 RepID=A0A4Q5LVX9_9BACT|nr:glycosyltransferase [Emticicia agri]RYU93725.1 glycosyltransferase [Emticicia agri]
MQNLAPIILFVYNRPNHTKRTVEALLLNNLANESELFIFSDASKDEQAKFNVDLVRTYITGIKGFKSVKIINRDTNYGLAKSIVEGVSEIIKIYGRVIVLEDDLVTHPQFLEFINKALDLYKESKEVFSITGYSHLNHSKVKSINKAYFIKLTSTWSWATWADRWDFFNEDIKESIILDKDIKLRKSFNYDNSYDFYKMLKNRTGGKVKSWGIVWYWNVFIKNGLTLYPSETLVDHIGLDGSGQNSKNYLIEMRKIKLNQYDFTYPIDIFEIEKDRIKVANTLKRRKMNTIVKILNSKIKNLLNFRYT